jgi:glutaredoxin
MRRISMYTLSTCPWCRKTKKFFTDRNIEFDFIDYDLADADTQQRIIKDMDTRKASGFPFVKINGDTVEGYNPDKYIKLLGL